MRELTSALDFACSNVADKEAAIAERNDHVASLDAQIRRLQDELQVSQSALALRDASNREVQGQVATLARSSEAQGKVCSTLLAVLADLT